MQDETHVFELLPAYALGALDDADAGQVVSHLAACTVCRAELADFQAVTDDLALPVPAASPSPAAKNILMERIAQAGPQTARKAPRPERRAPLFQRLAPAWGVIGVALIAALVVSNIFFWQQAAHPPEVFTGPLGMRAVALANSGAAPQASGIVIISADGQNGVLVVDELPELDPARQYQVWLLRGEQVTRGPAFTVDKTGYRGTRIIAPDSLLSYTAVRVTIEPVDSTGSTWTGDQVLGGPLHNPQP